MKKLTIALILALALGGIFFLSQWSEAERLNILDDVRITERDGCAVIRVGFNIPVRYVKHFPYESGDDLRIQLEAISISPGEREALFRNEYHRPPPDDTSGLEEVLYEGNVEGGPFLSLFFRTPVVFKVEQGSDFRSLVVVVTGPEAKEPCPPAQ